MSKSTVRWVIAQALATAVILAIAITLYHGATSTPERIVIVIVAVLMLTAVAAFTFRKTTGGSNNRLIG